MIYRSSAFILFLTLVSTTIFAQEQDYLWPTNASQHLTSTFGETRSAHFHSGLDIKTWGQEGYEVYASKDGVVYKMGVTVRGYGKVIYLKHEDGSFTVYAHLQRLNDRFQAIVDSVRMLDYSFETEIFAEEMNLQVKQGEVIGYTGSTGIGPPHLHFETRHPDETPFNALRTNLKVKDTIAPTLPALMAVPLSKESTIRGSKYPQLFYPTRNDEGVTDFGTIEANGPIGLTISANDGANEVTNQYAVYELGLIHQGDTLFYERLDEFRFSEDDLMFQDRIAATGATRKSYQTLFQKDGPTVPFYLITDPGTFINPGDSMARFTIFAKDYFGNETTAVVNVDGGNLNGNLPPGNDDKPLREWYWTEDWVTSGNRTINLDTTEFGTTWNDSLNQILTDISGEHFFFSRVQPVPIQRIVTPDQKVRVTFPKKSFFDTLSIAVSHSEYENLPYLQILPHTAGVRNDIEIQYYLDKDEYKKGNKYYLFRLDRIRNRITPVDSKLIGRTVYGYPSSLGEFLIMADNEPVNLSTPRIFKTDYGKWFFTVSAIDEGSGVDFKNTSITVNGVRGIAEFDYEEELLIYHHPDFIPQEKNVVEVTVADKAGNLFTKTFTL